MFGLGATADIGLFFDLLVSLFHRRLHANLWLGNKVVDDLVQVYVRIGHCQQRNESLHIRVEKYQFS